jgi:hypothetical protein
MPNLFAYAMLGIWTIIALTIYRVRPAPEATLWIIIGGFMVLPSATAVDLPMIPPLNKESIPAIAACLGCRYLSRKRIPVFRGWGLDRWLLMILITEPFLTCELNTDPIYIGGKFLPPMTPYSALSAVVRQFIFMIPFFLGRQLFREYKDQLLMFRVLVIGGLFYSLPLMLEVRLSPQLHNWIYGFFPHSFAQQIRFGGFRPVVFMGHGLVVAFFMMITVISATVFWRAKLKLRPFSAAGIVCYLLLMLMLCKSVASLLYGFSAVMLIKFASYKIQLRIARILVLIAMLYPTLSIMHVFPHQTLLNWAEAFDSERKQSLEFRFNNEQILLDRASQRLYFGWGISGRNRVFNEDSGEDESVTDGRWIITLGTFGLFGFIAEFGLLAISVWRAITSFKFANSPQEKTLLFAHALLVSIMMVDQLPNATLGGWIWLITGILLGRAETLANSKQVKTIN